MKSQVIRLLLLSLTLLPLHFTVHAQTHRGSIRGNVTDSSGTALPSAPIKLLHTETNESRIARSGDQGEFIVTALPPGPYRIEVESGGFKKYSRLVTLQVNQELRLDISLEVGPITEELVVNAPETALRKDSPTIGSVIENRQITGLPLDGRNFLELTLLVPGAVPSAPGSASSVRGDVAFNVNGAREDSNSFLLDGVYNFDPKLNSVGVNPPVDAIREFELLTTSYDAAFGRNAGGQVNVVLKSGSNSFHGAGYEFFRNGALDARNFFAPADQPAPKYQRNQFGFALGGPVVRNKTFFFADYEGSRVREGVTRVTNVPTLAERAGDFSHSLLAAPINPFTQQPFDGSKIPDFFINPIGKAIAALYPTPNRNVPFANFASSPASRDRSDHFDVRLNHSLARSSELAVRYSFSDRDLFEPFTGGSFPAVPGFGDNVPRRGQNFLISETHIFSPALVNEARFAFSRISAAVLQENTGTSINKQVGLPELSTNPRDFGLSFITISGFSPLGDEFNNPQQSETNVFQVLDGASYANGKHLVKFGFDFRGIQQNAFRDVQSRGFLTFSNFAFTGNALADLLLGFPAVTGGAHLDNPQHLRTESYGFYINDSFRVRPNLTLSAGLRYEFNSPPVDEFNRANLFDPATRSLVAVGTNGVPRSGYEADKNNWAPRVGLAWTVGSKGNTVLRGGYGMYFDQSSLAPSEGLYFNSPFFDFNLFFTIQGLFTLTLNDPFPSNFPFPLPKSAFGFQRDMRTPYLQHWNVSLQHELGKRRVVELAYVGSKGTKLITARDINQPRPSPASPNLRPNPQFDDITFEESSAGSNYNSLQVRFQQRLDFGLSILSSYTWSKSIDNASSFFSSAGDPNFPQDSFNTAGERGRSNFDVRHRLSLSYGYDFPCGKSRTFIANSGFLSTLLAG